MKKSILFFFLISHSLQAQEKSVINHAEIVKIETELASDKMQGRATFTSGIDSASAFIEREFSKAQLSHYENLTNYRQEFEVKKKKANNVIGVLLGNSKPDEYVIFSAHYDHLGVNENGADQVYNGANDDASGVTAVITLAKYFKEMNQNERTIIFVAFTGEEIGGFGSSYFSKYIDASKVIAMFNIEMIGTESKWGKNSAYITGFEKSDFGTILQENLKNTNFHFYPDPYPQEQLFYRSDNARLAALGVPAHTISTSKMDSEANYHKLSDEVSTLDLENMTQIIKAIAMSSQSIISGQSTPSRVK
jgi:Zn-dependent M28 family amino/carboxypeptidase